MAKKTTTAERKFPVPTAKDYEVLKSPLVTEKSMQLMQGGNKIVLKVSLKANATEIKKAFEAVFNKKVAKINTCNVRAKAKKMGRFEGTVPAYKKAIIFLAEGETLELFENEK